MSECVVDIIYWIWSSFLPFPYINNNWKKQNKQLESTENVAVTTEQIKTGEKKSQTEIQRNTKKWKKSEGSFIILIAINLVIVAVQP